MRNSLSTGPLCLVRDPSKLVALPSHSSTLPRLFIFSSAGRKVGARRPGVRPLSPESHWFMILGRTARRGRLGRVQQPAHRRDRLDRHRGAGGHPGRRHGSHVRPSPCPDALHHNADWGPPCRLSMHGEVLSKFGLLPDAGTGRLDMAYFFSSGFVVMDGAKRVRACDRAWCLAARPSPPSSRPHPHPDPTPQLHMVADLADPTPSTLPISALRDAEPTCLAAIETTVRVRPCGQSPPFSPPSLPQPACLPVANLAACPPARLPAGLPPPLPRTTAIRVWDGGGLRGHSRPGSAHRGRGEGADERLQGLWSSPRTPSVSSSTTLLHPPAPARIRPCPPSSSPPSCEWPSCQTAAMRPASRRQAACT